MAFKIYLKKDIKQEIMEYYQVPNPVEVATLSYSQGCFKHGVFSIPANNVLFIEEI